MQLDELRRAFALALKASENEAFSPEARAAFRQFADLIWRVCGERAEGTDAS